MLQGIGIAQALLNHPKILILDEPTSGLDPKERANFREMLAALEKDKIILLSTHIVSDVERIADDIMIMKEGRMVFQGENQGDLEELYLSFFRRKVQNGIDQNGMEKDRKDARYGYGMSGSARLEYLFVRDHGKYIFRACFERRAGAYLAAEGTGRVFSRRCDGGLDGAISGRD